jgi:hypothetical protein
MHNSNNDSNLTEWTRREYSSDAAVHLALYILMSTRALRIRINWKNLSPRILSRYTHLTSATNAKQRYRYNTLERTRDTRVKSGRF